MAVKKKNTDSDPSGPKKTRERDIRSSRRAAGVSVAIAIVAATALLIVINVISDKKNYRCDVETLGRYRLSDAAARILDQMDQPIRLTSIYTSTESDRKPQDYLPRVRDLMAEIARRKDNIIVVNVTSDREKAEVHARLRKNLDEAASGHRKVIMDFQILAGIQGPQFEQLTRQWQAYSSKGWLVQFAMPKLAEAAMTAGRDDLRTTSMELRQKLADASLPDYPGMVRHLSETLKKLRDSLENLSVGLRQLASLPKEASKSRPELIEAADKVIVAISRASEKLGKKGTPVPADPSAALKEFITSVRAVTGSAESAARRLEKFAGNGFAPYARSWRTVRGTLPDRYRRLAYIATGMAEQARGIQLAAKVEFQKKHIPQIRDGMLKFDAEARRIRSAVEKLLKDLTDLDEPTKEIFAQAGKDDYLQAILKPLNDLLARAAGAGPLDEQKELIQKIKQDNVVLVEIGSRTGVVGFDEVWPLASRPEMGRIGDKAKKPKRVFYGDMAICTRILSLASDPFAEVVLTYFEQIPPQYLQRRQPTIVGSIYSGWLQTVRERLERANLKISEWNIAKQDSPPKPTDNIRQVLLILPPPEPSPMPPMPGMKIPQWSPDEVEKVRKVIAGGTPAVFLAGYVFPRYTRGIPLPGYYGFSEYLRIDWKLDVKTSLRVIQAKADPLNPGEFKLPIHTWRHMRLSTFTDHPVGRPLKARRMYLFNACPIVKASGKAGSPTGTAPARNEPNVEVKDILIVPKHRNEMWAISDIEAFIIKVKKRKPLEPDRKEVGGDLLGPFAVAVEASRKIKGKQARIIVLAAADSFTDYYLQDTVMLFREDGTIDPEPPPTGNVDLLINSVYHLIGKGEYIGAGPAIIEPVEIAPKTMVVVKILFGLAWPGLMFAIGGAVVLLRKR